MILARSGCRRRRKWYRNVPVVERGRSNPARILAAPQCESWGFISALPTVIVGLQVVRACRRVKGSQRSCDLTSHATVGGFNLNHLANHSARRGVW